MYTIKELSNMAGVSTRAIRWYEQQGLIKPQRLTNGYRVYSPIDVDRLQQVLYFRELGLGLKEINQIMNEAGYDPLAALEQQLTALKQRHHQTSLLILNLEKTIELKRHGIEMNDDEKFEALKQQSLAQNEQKYGEEARARFGEDTVEKANRRYAGLSKEAYQQMEALTESLNSALAAAVANGDPKSDEGLAIMQMHKEWLCIFWPEYNAEMHRNLAQMYVDDPRFKAYYDDIAEGAAQYLYEAISFWAE
ncbi:MAG: MerR family transcriptional regulator [Coriobacteriia bacterium]|nr:MerR family transcriptional regulator [Coriobacteriia bacterium]